MGRSIGVSSMDEMVLATQKWLNRTYVNDNRFNQVEESGHTGWNTIFGLIRALQIELGIQFTADNFGEGTKAKFSEMFPNGISRQTLGKKPTSNIYAIIQGALWCKGYAAHYGSITNVIDGGTVESILKLKNDMGLIDHQNNFVVDIEMMGALLSMKQFRLLAMYGGKTSIREIQQEINRRYREYTGIIPTDGIYGREMNEAMIQVLQAIEGFTPEEATGYFGNGTRARLKTIDSGSSDWVWLASSALVCNGIRKNTTRSWSFELSEDVRKFQESYALPVTSVIDKTTWMSLLTSKGDSDRKCVACDTRFEITDDLASCLKEDGYRIVGRYLCEPDQEMTAENDLFKALRTGELDRIVSYGLEYFPIFQMYSTKLNHFSYSEGKNHALEAVKHAKRLGVPKTVIYFTVDYDATDPEIDSNIIPYFKALKENIRDGYLVGIYASRNICSRIIHHGLAEAAFVSDMSTGYSGNLGFSIPDQWVFDQFTEITGYRGRWDLDRVAYSGKFPACSLVVHNGQGKFQHEDIINAISQIEKIAIKELKDPITNQQLSKFILEYLRKPEYWAKGNNALMWQVYTPESYDSSEEILKEEVNRICKSIIPDPGQFKTTYDLEHFAATALGNIHHFDSTSYDYFMFADLGGWILDLLQIWGDSQKEGIQKQYLPNWLSVCLGSRVIKSGFGYKDLMSDVDGYLTAVMLHDKDALLSEVLRYIFSLAPLNRRSLFCLKRFKGERQCVENVFDSLVNGLPRKEIPFFDAILLRTSASNRLPDESESKYLSNVLFHALTHDFIDG